MAYLSEIATTIACMGGFLFGYDTGVISGVLVMPTFASTFGITAEKAADVKGNVVALLQVGCAVGALLINFIADIFGRKKAIMLSTFIFIVGGIMQAVSAPYLSLLIAGRFIAGGTWRWGQFYACAHVRILHLAQGRRISDMMFLLTIAINLFDACNRYIAEIAPRKLRGRLGTLWQFLIVSGIMVSYWVDYACLKTIETSDKQWQLALGLQIVPGVILFFGIIPMPESIRWLASKGRFDDARKTMAALRNLPEDDPTVEHEMADITRALEIEKESGNGKWTEIFQPMNFRRLIIGCCLQMFQQWTGSNAINYYAPNIFQSIGIESAEIDVLATGVYGIVKVAFVFISFFMIDTKLGRRRTLMIGSLFMCTAFYVLGGMTKIISDENGGNITGKSTVGAPGYIAILMVYFFAIGFEFSWGKLEFRSPALLNLMQRGDRLCGLFAGTINIAFRICFHIASVGFCENVSWDSLFILISSPFSEIYPTRIRAVCLSLTTAVNWAMNATIGKVTPIMLANVRHENNALVIEPANITYGTYFVFGTFAIIMGLFVFFFLPETRGRSLEEMEEIFQGSNLVYNQKYTPPAEDADFKE
ncbi:general substrate transporter [Jimgerdemannia flammicorona]|uniref:General substrate transporter n=1 Tax=Jimgerdemannia flammicorona TaxID=994334 RepID=A0A433D2J8_9FUNG|nr:general substrate transporter [Jimgerdemannia flammicorona]